MEWITSGLFTKMIMYFSMMDLLYFAFLFKKKGKKHKNKKNCTGQRPFQRASYIHKIRFIISLFRNSTQSSFFGEYDEHNVRWWDVIIVLCSYFFFFILFESTLCGWATAIFLRNFLSAQRNCFHYVLSVFCLSQSDARVSVLDLFAHLRL